MDTRSNVAIFNEAVPRLVVRLYDAFPGPCRLDPDEIHSEHYFERLRVIVRPLDLRQKVEQAIDLQERKVFPKEGRLSKCITSIHGVVKSLEDVDRADPTTIALIADLAKEADRLVGIYTHTIDFLLAEGLVRKVEDGICLTEKGLVALCRVPPVLGAGVGKQEAVIDLIKRAAKSLVEGTAANLAASATIAWIGAARGMMT